MKKRILVICPHPENVAPGQRLKYEQYFDSWRDAGYEITISPFMTMRFWNIVYKPGRFLEKALWTLYGYFIRIMDLFRIKKYDVVYVFLWGTPFGSSFYERILRNLASNLVFDIDDMVFLGHSSAANRFFQPLKGRNKMIYLMRVADHVITCTPQLDRFTRRYNINTTDISSTVDTNKRYQVVNTYQNDHKLVLGWSGSHSTSKYLYLLEDALKELAQKHDFILRVMGDKSFKIDGVEVEAFEWQEPIEMETLQSFDIGLYPLPDEEWVYGKSGLKAIQYMALGIPTVATAIGANFRIIEDAKNGFLVEVDDYNAWRDRLDELIESASKRKQFGEAARKTIVDKYSVGANEGKYLKAFETIQRVKSPKQLVRKSISPTSKEKKVLALTNSLDGGGAERVMSIIANGLIDKHQVDLLLLSKSVKQRIDPQVNIGLIQKIHRRDHKLFKLLNIPFIALSLANYMRATQPDVLLSFLNRPNFIAVLAKYFYPKQRVVISERTFPSKAYASKKWNDRLTRSLIHQLYRKADLVIVNSIATKENLIASYGVPENKVSLLHNPLDFKLIDQLRYDEVSVTHRREGYKFLMLGRIDENKNQLMAVQAFLASKLDNAWLYIFGEGGSKSKLEQYIAEHDHDKRIILDSFQDNPFKWIEYCDCVILNSDFEGFPNVILETIACSKPVISSNCESGPREILCSEYEEPNFENDFYEASYGLLFPVGNQTGLEKSIQYMADNKELNDKYKYYNRVRSQHYSTDKFLAKLEGLLFS